MSMTVGELREKLKGIDDDKEVILSSDPEGNDFHGVFDVDNGNLAYEKHGRYTEIGLEKLTDRAERKGYAEAVVLDDGEACVVFWPE